MVCKGIWTKPPFAPGRDHPHTPNLCLLCRSAAWGHVKRAVDGHFSSQSGFRAKAAAWLSEGYKVKMGMRKDIKGEHVENVRWAQILLLFPLPFLGRFFFRTSFFNTQGHENKKGDCQWKLHLENGVSAARSTRENRKVITLKKHLTSLWLLLRLPNRQMYLFLKSYTTDHLSYISVNLFEYHSKTQFKWTYGESKIPIRYNWRMYTF